MWRRARDTVSGILFANFFVTLLACMCAAQWLVIVWLLPSAWVWTWYVHPLLLGGLAALNFYIRRNSALLQHGPKPPRPIVRRYYAVSITCIFVAAYLAVVTGAWIVATRFFESQAIATAIAVVEPIEVEMRGFFRLTGDVGASAIALLFAYGYTVGYRQLKVTRVSVRPRGWPAELHGLTIAHLSDIHIGQNLEKEQLAGFVEQVNRLEPDLVCITGDVIDSASADAEGFLPILARLSAPHGVYVVLGNHDHYSGAERVAETITRITGFPVLRDARAAIPMAGTVLHVIGLDDRGLDWARGVTETVELAELRGEVPDGQGVLLLNHRPDIFHQAARLGIGLTLSGHTHGGQVGFRIGRRQILSPAMVLTRFDRGLFERDGSILYVNNGIGVTLQRIRLATPREIGLFEIQTV